MAHQLDFAKLQGELVDAFEWCEEERASALVSQLAAHPRQGRAVLDQMLASPDASVRRAAVFGLGELGGAASVKRLEQQMAIEEARDDYDGESVLEVLTQALGRIKASGARTSLIRRLTRLAAGKLPNSDLDDVAYALWRKRHPELIPVIRSALEKIPPEKCSRLLALLRLLESSPEALATWVLDATAPLKDKTKVLTILDEEVPDELLPVMPAFIAAATSLGDAVVTQNGEAAYYCDRLFTTLGLHRERVLPSLPAEARAELHTLARRCVPAVSSNCARRAVWMLEYVGRPEDVPLIEAHRPAEPVLAKTVDKVIRALRNLPTA